MIVINIEIQNPDKQKRIMLTKAISDDEINNTVRLKDLLISKVEQYSKETVKALKQKSFEDLQKDLL